MFVNNGSDLNLYWAHLRVNNTTSNTAPVSDFEGPLYAVGPESAAISKANGQVKYGYDVLNGDLAKHINIDPNLKTRILAGITGLWLNEQINATYSGPPKFIILSQSTSKFNGAGLRLGLDTNYNLVEASG